MRIKILMLCLLLSSAAIFANEENKRVLLTGASFAVAENGWFELGCEALGLTPVNKAVSGQAIMQTAQAMSKGTLYTIEGLETIESFVIMHVHNQNVANEQWLKEDYNDYTLTDATPYAVAYDYVIRKYLDDCKSLKDVPTSKYYGTETGKPANILLCTHWHDSRTIYNPAIRILAEKWNLPLIEWDTNIGFTKDVLDDDGRQPSLKYSGDTETINNVKYGWHPLRGKGQYIQKKMAEIYVAKLAEVLNIEIPLSVTADNKSIAVLEGEKAYVRFEFTGLSPWKLTYQVDGETFELDDINENPLLLEITDAPTKEGIEVVPLAVSNVQMQEGEASGMGKVYKADNQIVAFYDTHVHEYYKSQSFPDEKVIQLKTGDGWTRQVYYSFNIDQIDDTDERIVFRSYFSAINLQDDSMLQLEGNTETYSNTLNWNNKDSKPFDVITTNKLYYSDVESFICWDVTDFVKEKKQQGATVVTFRVSVIEGRGALCSFHSIESDDPQYHPAMLIVKDDGTNGLQSSTVQEDWIVYSSPFCDCVMIENVKGADVLITDLSGICYYRLTNVTDNMLCVDTSSFPNGVYWVISPQRIQRAQSFVKLK